MSSESLYEIESEKSFLGFLLIKGTGDLVDFPLQPEDFYSDIHRRIFKAVLYLIDQRINVDPVSVFNYLRENSLFEDESREYEYIRSLYRDSVVSQPIQYYVSRIKRFSEKRKYAKTLEDSLKLLESEGGENESLFNQIEKSLTEISRTVDVRGLRHVKDEQNNLIDYITNIFQNKGQVSGLRTNFQELDEVTSGLKEYELFILAARPGNGKTTFALNIASNVAMHYKEPVVIFSLEMSSQELLLKMICSHAQVENSKLKKAEISSTEHPRLIQGIIDVTSAPIWIDDSGSLTIDDFRGRVRKLLTQQNHIGLIIVDYLQLMSDPKNRDSGRQQEVASISRALKAMAKEASCPIIALSQMSRAVEQRSKDQRPQLSDLRESGAIEQDADIVAFIYREDMVKREEGEVDESKKGLAEIIVAKNRSGPLRSFFLAFRPELSRFDNVDIPIS